MDLIKIGKYISEKRKALGLTQKQLAEKIGMSDKSVSKWERGVCLPDVSVYLELCEILGIHINEFLAGEDLKEEHMIKQSEDNLLQVAKESKDRQKHLKKIVLALAACILFSVILLGIALARIPRRPQNYIEAFSRDSAEMKTAEILRRGQELSFCYNSGGFTRLFVKMSKSFLINFQDFFLRKNFRVILQV